MIGELVNVVGPRVIHAGIVTTEIDDRLRRLLAHRTEFLRFLQARVGSAAAAEDLLQDSLVKALAGVQSVRDDAALLGWFYRVLENAANDHHRRHAAASRATEAVTHEQAEPHAGAHVPDDAPAKVCPCVMKLKAGLKPSYAEALDRVELDEMAVKDFADEAGISRSNAAVRVFRAREALRARVDEVCGHCASEGCRDCTCGH